MPPRFDIISTPYHGYLKNLVLALGNKWDSHLTPLWDGGHIKLWSRKTLSQLLSEAGFHVVRFIGAGRLPFLEKHDYGCTEARRIWPVTPTTAQKLSCIAAD
jgi:hypothetical protein